MNSFVFANFELKYAIYYWSEYSVRVLVCEWMFSTFEKKQEIEWLIEWFPRTRAFSVCEFNFADLEIEMYHQNFNIMLENRGKHTPIYCGCEFENSKFSVLDSSHFYTKRSIRTRVFMYTTTDTRPTLFTSHAMHVSCQNEKFLFKTHIVTYSVERAIYDSVCISEICEKQKNTSWKSFQVMTKLHWCVVILLLVFSVPRFHYS